MNKKLLLWFVFVIFSISFSLTFAGNKANGENATGGSGSIQDQSVKTRERNQEMVIQDNVADRTPERSHNREMENNQDNDASHTREQTQERVMRKEQDNIPYYQAKDGKQYEWKNRYTQRIKEYEANEDFENMNKYLYRIAHRYRFKREEDTEGFIAWTKKNKPWNKSN